MQCGCLTELSLCCQCHCFVATRTRNVKINALSQTQIGLNSPIEEVQRLIIVSKLVVNNCRIDIDLSSTQKFVMAHEDFTCRRRILERLCRTIQTQAGTYTPNACTRPPYFVVQCQELFASRIQ